MSIRMNLPVAIATSILVGLTAGITIPEIVNSAPAKNSAAKTSVFPDVEPDYWATPFIQALAEENILAGYPDGTYRPQSNIDRDEFAAVIRQAFQPNPVREIQSGSTFNDVPENYWAAPAIEEAYETGFLDAYSNNNLFYPRQEITRAQAIAAIAQGLNLTPSRPESTAYQTTPEQPTREPTNRPKVVKNRLAFPLASTALMYPFVMMNRASDRTPTPEQPVASTPSQDPEQQAFQQGVSSPNLDAYYTDAERIPEEAIEPVAAATGANIVVNYPDPSLLNPNELLNRGSAAALIHQALVYQGKMQPLPESSEATNYIVNSPTQNAQNPEESTQQAN